jgi:hypothetical protein
MPNTIKVLFLSANPHSAPALEFGREVRRIVDAIRKSTGRDRLEFSSEWAAGPADLQDSLRRYSPHVVHFSGHGDAEGGIWLEDGTGASCPVSGEALSELFAILKGSIRVVLLNACDSLPAVKAIHGVIDYAIGMSAPISDPAAIVFAEAFYGALASGAPVREAFGLGVNRLRMEGSGETEVPTLLVRDGAEQWPLVSPASPPLSREAVAAGAGSGITFNNSTVGHFNSVSGNGTTIINNGG